VRILLVMLAVSSLLACSRSEADDPTKPFPGAPAPAAAAPPAATPVTTAAAPGAVTVRSGGADVLSINRSGEDIEIAVGNQKLHGEAKDSGKRKYSIDGGAVSYEVKPNEEGGFKLRTADGKLRWKVKVSADKIKISDNEENNNPFELKMRDGGRVKVVAPGDKELGNVRFEASKIEVENAAGQKQFEIAASAASAAYGVLLLEAIPQQERAILVAEILSRGR
jgi:hypothetical protein